MRHLFAGSIVMLVGTPLAADLMSLLILALAYLAAGMIVFPWANFFTWFTYALLPSLLLVGWGVFIGVRMIKNRG